MYFQVSISIKWLKPEGQEKMCNQDYLQCEPGTSTLKVVWII